MNAIERRTIVRRSAVTREKEDGPAKISGYGAVYYDAADPGTEYRLWQDTFERFAPGAFDGAVKPGADVRSLFNHDSNFVLGRTISDPATLVLAVDKVGLRYDVSPPDTQLVRDAVLTPIERGDVDGASIAFYVRKVAWILETRGERQVEVREIQEAELVEVGPVTFPAYASTSAGTRSSAEVDHDALMQERAERLKRNSPPPAGPTDVDVRLLQVAAHQTAIGNRARN